MSGGFTTRPELRGSFGMVASTHWLSTAAGMAVLEAGGNAADAAVAAGFALQVVEPYLNGLGGDLPILYADGGRRSVDVICGQGPAPAAATSDRFRDLGVSIIPGDGLLPACVPGAFGAWLMLLRDHGTLRLRDVLRHAISYAEDGYPLVAPIIDAIARAELLFREHWTENARLYLTREGAPSAGSRFRNPDLAATYRRLLAEAEAAGEDRERQIETARHAFYEGFVADAIDRYASRAHEMDSSGERHPALLTGADLAAWSATLEPPLSYPYGPYEVHKTDTWGQGLVFLQQLALLKQLDLESLAFAGDEYIHAVTECAKLAFADREAFYGDPKFVEVPVADLLSDVYAADRAALVGPEASLELRPGRPGGHEPRLASEVTKVRALPWRGDPTLMLTEGRGDTCHVDVADRWGNLVSATPSGGTLQGSPVVPGLGFTLGTRGQMFCLEPGLPGSIAPGKRPRSTLSPSIAFRDGKPFLAFGTPGGDWQDQWSLHFFLALAHGESNLQAAIDRPAFHTDHFPSSFYPRRSKPGSLSVESRLDGAVVGALRQRGHRVDVLGPWALGRLSAAGIDPSAGGLRAAADPRGAKGYAAGR